MTLTLSKSEIIKVTLDKGLAANMGILNNNDKAVEFKIKMIVTIIVI